MTRTARIVGSALTALIAGAAITGCGAGSLTVSKLASAGIGAPPSDAAAQKYGVVSIPGKKNVFLPKGRIALYFSDFVQGGDGNVENGTVPALTLEMSGPGGGPPYPKVTNNYGTATEVNGRVWLQINTVDIRKAGKYRISVSGQTNGYITPQLLLGQ